MTSSTTGSGHWKWQRVTAVLLIPLTLWFMFSIVRYIDSGFEELVAWVSRPWVAVLLLLYLATMFWHAWLGVRVVIEDYIHSAWLNRASLLLGKGTLLLSALVSGFAVLRIAL